MFQYKDTCYIWTELNTDNSHGVPWSRDLPGVCSKSHFFSFLAFQRPSLPPPPSNDFMMNAAGSGRDIYTKSLFINITPTSSGAAAPLQRRCRGSAAALLPLSLSFPVLWSPQKNEFLCTKFLEFLQISPFTLINEFVTYQHRAPDNIFQELIDGTHPTENCVNDKIMTLLF